MKYLPNLRNLREEPVVVLMFIAALCSAIVQAVTEASVDGTDMAQAIIFAVGSLVARWQVSPKSRP